MQPLGPLPPHSPSFTSPRHWCFYRSRHFTESRCHGASEGIATSLPYKQNTHQLRSVYAIEKSRHGANWHHLSCHSGRHRYISLDRSAVLPRPALSGTCQGRKPLHSCRSGILISGSSSADRDPALSFPQISVLQGQVAVVMRKAKEYRYPSAYQQMMGEQSRSTPEEPEVNFPGAARGRPGWVLNRGCPWPHGGPASAPCWGGSPSRAIGPAPPPLPSRGGSKGAAAHPRRTSRTRLARRPRVSGREGRRARGSAALGGEKSVCRPQPWGRTAGAPEPHSRVFHEAFSPAGPLLRG